MNVLKQLRTRNVANEIIGIDQPDSFVQIELCFGLIQHFFEMLLSYASCFDPRQDHWRR